MSTVDKIKSRGHWVVSIHPETYIEERVKSLQELEDLVRANSVAVRGWDFPHYDYKERVRRAPSYIEQSVDWQGIIELWRAYKSGQLVSLSSLWGDWRDEATHWETPRDWHPGATLGVEDAIFRLVEIFEFSARWAAALKDAPVIAIDCHLKNLQGRELEIGSRRMPFVNRRVCDVEEWSFSRNYNSADLLGNTKDLAIDPAIELFELFSWDLKPEAVRDIQAELRR